MNEADTDLPGLLQKAADNGVELVRFFIADACGNLRGKVSSLSSALPRFESGIGLVKGTMAMNMLDQLQADTGLGAVGEVRMVPEPETFTILPYAEASASVFCRMEELDGRPWSHCPRAFLRRQVEEAEKLGFRVLAAYEPEFILGRESDGEFRPIDRGLCFSSESMHAADHFITAVVKALKAQGIELEQYYPELGAGQHELSISPAQPMLACDQYLLLKETVRALAQAQGLSVTFAPKRSASEPGNGAHLHLSLWTADGKENLFYGDAMSSPDGDMGLSQLALSFIAGVHQHLKALCALTCPSVNSYQRLKPSHWSSAFTAWGFENREAAIRVPSVYRGRRESSTNIELKCVDSTINPYLALGAVLACGLDGIHRKLSPPAPVAVDPAEMEADFDLCALSGLEPLPRSLNDALTELEADLFLMKSLGAELVNTYIIVKTSEVAAMQDDPPFAFSQHRQRY